MNESDQDSISIYLDRFTELAATGTLSDKQFDRLNGYIEELISELKAEFTIAIVTHNMQQAARISDYTAYMYLGEMVEYGVTDQIFIKPRHKQTEDYITGRFG